MLCSFIIRMPQSLWATRTYAQGSDKVLRGACYKRSTWALSPTSARVQMGMLIKQYANQHQMIGVLIDAYRASQQSSRWVSLKNSWTQLSVFTPHQLRSL